MSIYSVACVQMGHRWAQAQIWWDVYVKGAYNSSPSDGNHIQYSSYSAPHLFKWSHFPMSRHKGLAECPAENSPREPEYANTALKSVSNLCCLFTDSQRAQWMLVCLTLRFPFKVLTEPFSKQCYWDLPNLSLLTPHPLQTPPRASLYVIWLFRLSPFHTMPGLVFVVAHDQCFLVFSGRKRRMVRFLTPWAAPRPPSSSQDWAQAKSTRSN